MAFNAMPSITVKQAIFLVGGPIALYLLLRRPAHSLWPSSSFPSAKRRSHPDLPECPAPDGPVQSPPQAKGVRLCQVYPSPESEIATDVDVIAIHGLDTDSPRTWTWKHQDSEKRDVNWLKDPDMLPKRIPTARIFTCNWPADLFEQPDLVQKTIDEFARLLLAGIESRPPAINEDPGKDDRPIIFIASCLGGVVLMKALVMADGEYLTVGRATRGIIFLATPFRGTAFQDIAQWAEPGLKAWALIQDKNVSNLLEHVKSTFDLEELVRGFFASFCQKNNLVDNVSTFYETGTTSLPRKIAPWLPAFWSQEQPLVNRRSATLDFVPHPLPLDRPHIQTNKFRGPDDPGYISVAGAVESLLRKVRAGQPVEIANVWIRDKRYSRKNLEIERLSGDQLPMDRCYINLAIVKQLGGNTLQQSAPFSLFARLNVETPQEGTEVTLPTLFTPSEAHNGQVNPSRILIHGRAGVGKTTLCKKIVYDFTYSTLWRDQFDCVLWVPLRNLKLEGRRQIAGYNFKDLFHHEYFSQHPEGDRLAEALWHAVKDNKPSKVLFILDGLDEAPQDSDSDMFRFIEELLNQPNVIITSRPNATLPAKLDPIHLELETIGFYTDQVEAYIENAFTDPETRKSDLAKIENVQSFLDRHQLVQSLVRIPIQLDAFCYTWNDSYDKGVQKTMTTVYENMEKNLWKKDARNLEKRTQHQIKVAQPSEISKSIKYELNLLEFLAFTGMYNNIIDFEPKHRDEISNHFDYPNVNFLLDEMLGRVSFMRSSDLSLKKSDRSYHFLHLTFQEYFGARCFVRQWIARQPLKCLVLRDRKIEAVNPVKFLGKYKYNARYDIFWRFVAGLLEMEGEEITRFFQQVEEEPRDLLGPTHQRLVMHCLSEVSTKMPLRRNLEGQLLQWAFFEYRLVYASRLIHEREFPMEVLEKCFLQASKETAERLVEMLSGNYSSSKVLSKELVRAIGGHLENENSSVKMAAIKALGSQQLTEEHLKAITARLEDKESYVREAAIKALRSQQITEEHLKAIAARPENKESSVREATIEALKSQQITEESRKAIAAHLIDKNWAVRMAAIRALQDQQITEEYLKPIAALLKDGSPAVRYAAVVALQSQPALPEGLLEAIAAHLADEDLDVRCAALQALEKQSALPEELLEAIVARLGDKDSSVEYLAVQTLEKQSALPEGLHKAIAARLRDEDSSVRYLAVQMLEKQSALPEELLEAIAARLGDDDSTTRCAGAEALIRRRALALIPHRYVKSLYRILLETSFAAHSSWHVMDKTSYITLGHKEYSEDLPDGFMDAIKESQEDLSVPSRHSSCISLGV